MSYSSVDRLVEFLIKRKYAIEADRRILSYGLYTGLETLLIISISLLFGLFFGHLGELCVFLVAFTPLRKFAGGYHSKHAGRCFIFSIGAVLVFLTCIRYVSESKLLWISLIVWFVSSFFLSLYMPVESQSKPLDSKEKVYFRRKSLLILAIECIAVFLFLKLGFKKIASAISMSITFTAFLVLLEVCTRKIPTKQDMLTKQ